jgi:hypothetical protein
MDTTQDSAIFMASPLDLIDESLSREGWNLQQKGDSR